MVINNVLPYSKVAVKFIAQMPGAVVMIGFIKNLFSSILSFFVGLFGGKKSLESKSSTTSAEKLAADTAKTGNKILSSFTGLLGDKKSQDESSTKSAKSAAATAKPRKRSGYFMELDETEETTSVNGNQPKVTEAKTSEPVAAAKPVKEESAKTPAPVAAKSAKEEPAQISEAAASAQSAKIDLVQTAKGVEAVPTERGKSPVASTNGQNPTETTFAPKYLAPNTTSNSRRRPGPSMNPFLDMARQVKNPG